jgi:hypothetical protein
MRTVILTAIAMLATAGTASGQVSCSTYYNVTTCSGITTTPQPPLVIQQAPQPQPHAFTQGLTGGAYALDGLSRAELQRRQAELYPAPCYPAQRWLGLCK